MFLNDEYINEKFISSIKYEIISHYSDIEVIKILDSNELWEYTKNGKNNYFSIIDDVKNHLFGFITQDRIGNIKIDRIDDIEIDRETQEWGNNNYFNQKSYVEDKKTIDNFYIQQKILSSPVLNEYVRNSGAINIKIKMTNGDKFDDNILGWCYREKYDEDNNQIIIEEEIPQKYKDREVNIDYIYDMLMKNKLVYI